MVSALETRRRALMFQPHRATATGAVASFRTDVVSALPMEFDLVPIQAGTGDPSPENKRPITGHDGFTRTRVGANLFGGDEWLTTGSGTVDLENRTVSGGNNNQNIANISLFKKYKQNTQYTLIVDYTTTGTNGRPGYRFNYTDGTYDNLKDSVETANTRRVSAFVSARGKTVANIGRTSYSGTKTFYVDGCGIFEGVLTAQQYKAYVGHSYETEFPTPPGTVYGCHVRDNGDGTGTLVLTHKMDDMGNLTWNRSANYDYFTANITEMKSYSAGETPSITCEIYKTTTAKGASSWLNAEDKTIGTRATYTNLVVKDTSYTDKDAFKTAVSGYKVVYPLAEPQTYTLSLTALQSLVGQNHVWVDNADSVSVEYWGH